MYMNINELFEKLLQDRFLSEELNGEITLHGNCIIWEYYLENDGEEVEIYTNFEDYYDEEIEFDFKSLSSEELLLEAYDKDLEMIKSYLDKLEEIDNWSFSDPYIIDNTIAFKIF